MSAREDRRLPRSAALRRLITAGNLLAAAARGHASVTPEIADAWDSTLDALRADLVELRVAPDPRMRGVPSIETIGTCDHCGVTDHHLILGICPGCTDTIAPQTIDCTMRCADFAQVASEVPLGAEADVSHVRRPRGAR